VERDEASGGRIERYERRQARNSASAARHAIAFATQSLDSPALDSPGISIPSVPARRAGLNAVSKPRTAGQETCRVFLVDDHPLVREWLCVLIDGYADLGVCGEASCVSEAVRGISELKPDVAIVDLSLPDGSGFDIIRHMRVHSPATSVVVLSMHEERSYAKRSIRAGARAYVMKGDATHAIIEAVRKVAKGEIFLSPSMKVDCADTFVNGVLANDQSPDELLSQRELEVFQLLGRTHGTRQISVKLQISIKTVQSFCERIKDKLQLRTANELVREAIRWVDAQDVRND
jgi:DNA-binding NarL/FixJ family response regulator